MRFKFKNPKKVDIIILDSNGVDLFKKYVIDKKHSYDVVESNLNTIYITPLMLWMIIKNIFRIKNKEKNILSYLYKINLLSVLNLYNPKIILTFTDNNLLYHWLIRNDSTISYLAIQNGIRQKFEFDILKKLSSIEINHDYYFCFGEYDIDFHKKMGFSIRKAFACGSLKLGISDLISREITNKYDICLLSNYKKKSSIKNCHITNEISENNLLLDKYIKDYCDKNKKSIIIALRSTKDAEKNYYKSIYGDDTNFTTGQIQSYSSYTASIQSEITVGYQTTLLLETLAIKNKVLHIDFTKNNIFFDYDSPIKHEFISFKEMEKELNTIYSMDINDYEISIKTQQKYVMNYNSNNPPHQIINAHINEIINTISHVS